MDASVLNRRGLLRLFGSAGVASLLGEAMRADAHLVPARAAVDHLLLGVADRDRGIAWVEDDPSESCHWRKPPGRRHV